ncbi:AbrB family transcriptional regulator [Mesorhizobium sp. ASY16-5R]|uniref:AbrB family transcriptional regulator n=1 Tax=Mesorhizobium sp. ASY16-5R TaxID=3445772 RepID=UPI003FA134A3
MAEAGRAPGGLAEMSLIALVLQIETAFMVCHHVARILMVVVGAALAFRRFVAAK